ncbi:hydantoinase/carbamoylase family amidase [Verminephrobacter eiseniae]|uniref:hydantoinase/carbamoylase family amidase n=1 Tax=Verminephrobacter eiseniae TaxID=364317 RepID=UPI0022389AF3|nr:hydantoinase/carbamoylase family amidase [Verminephrobacter eiseniae]MCW5230611.1 hydantoinase/carbamoylase family amidase [Verminephrobacter eiseniae]MCW5292344.1 hydantoinase/carbamoylase family amidase [Verminephrobacter eiseniae]MCW8183354.1 hydantoinase/carbamoylase family amidase [Verminephrobacter eiseniae]MCW8223078.1 hydantoinase/carbamoylase family amidase [Verminephrobacter eiseniae]MCW8234343.1 hydantoinase/carbamoylase family amidase [Verminephrobacter eiseniae]
MGAAAASAGQRIWRIDADRLWERLMALARIGATPGGGVDRQALSAQEIASWRTMIDWALPARLEPSTDAAGNLFIALPGADRNAPPVLTGSHLDSQPGGGRFDGVYGVLAALEVLTTLAGHGVHPPVDIICVAWMNEEGSRFAPGMMGSQAFAGVRSIEAVRAVRDADGIPVAAALDALHAAFPALRRRPLGFPVAAYVEAHIEQGPVLQAQQRVIGVVTGIQGKKTFDIVISGARGHAGTLAMAERRDALWAFTRIAAALYAEIGGHDDAVKFTIGRLQVAPNAPSVVPERVTLRIDLRHPDDTVLEHLGQRLVALCQALAAPCRASVTPLADTASNGFDPALQQAIAQAAACIGQPHMPILSAAGHDARQMAPLCPSAMIFIPCRDGVSHAEHEWAEPAHVAAGANVLLHVLLPYARAGAGAAR